MLHLDSKPEVDGHQGDNSPILTPWTHQQEGLVDELPKAKKWTLAQCPTEDIYLMEDRCLVEDICLEEDSCRGKEEGRRGTLAKLSVTHVTKRDTLVATACSIHGTNEVKGAKL